MKATALGAESAGPKAGVEQTSLATGVIVSEHGLVLTVYHFLTKLGNFEPQTLQMRASISKKEDAPSMHVSLVDGNPTLDLLLLKINVENALTPKIVLGNTSSLSDAEQIYSSGFLEGQGYLTGEGKITAREGPIGYVYATNIAFGYGQSGSPVYDKDAKLIGIAKGSLTKKDTTNYFIPIEFAESLLFEIRIPEIIQFMEKIGTKFSGTLDPTVLDTRVKEIEERIQRLRERFDWRAELNNTTKKAILSYEKLLSGDPHPSQISLKITPLMATAPLPTWPDKTYVITTPNPIDSGTFELDGVFDALAGIDKSYSLSRVTFTFAPQLPDGRTLRTENLTINYPR